jgi:cytochrome c5
VPALTARRCVYVASGSGLARDLGRASLHGFVALVCLVAAGCGGHADDVAAKSPGETTYNRYCFSCHAAGVAGAPRVGDAVAWAPRIAKGQAALVASATNGLPPGMPPRGLCLQCSEADLRAAIEYMTTRSR